MQSKYHLIFSFQKQCFPIQSHNHLYSLVVNWINPWSFCFSTENSWKLWKKAEFVSTHTHTEVPCSSSSLHYREPKKHLPHEAGQEFPLKDLITAQKSLLYSSFHCIKSFTLNSKTFLENIELYLWTLHFFISGGEKLYKQFVFHNEEVLYPFQLQTLQTSLLCSGERYFMSQCGINETYHCTEDQKAFFPGRFSHCQRKSFWDHSTLIKCHPFRVLLNNQL